VTGRHGYRTETGREVRKKGISASFFVLLARRASARDGNAGGVRAGVARVMLSVQSNYDAWRHALHPHERAPDGSLRSLNWLSCAMAAMHHVRRPPASESTKLGALPNRSRAHSRHSGHCGHRTPPKLRCAFHLTERQPLSNLASRNQPE
jgi:hypothetical protein